MEQERHKPKRTKTVRFKKTRLGNILVFPRYNEKEIKYHSFFKLGKFESQIFLLCDGKNTTGQIIERLFKELGPEGVTKAKIRSETRKFSDEMKKHGLIE